MECKTPFKKGPQKGLPRTGTVAGRTAHLRAGEPLCGPCFLAWRLYRRDNRRNNVEREREQNSRANYKRYHDDPQKARDYVKARRELVRNLPGSHTRREWLDLLQKYDHRCFYCGSRDRVGKDHVLAVTRPGSSNDISNILPCCFLCNTSKGRALLQNWDPDSYQRWQLDLLLT